MVTSGLARPTTPNSTRAMPVNRPATSPNSPPATNRPPPGGAAARPSSASPTATTNATTRTRTDPSWAKLSK